MSRPIVVTQSFEPDTSLFHEGHSDFGASTSDKNAAANTALGSDAEISSVRSQNNSEKTAEFEAQNAAGAAQNNSLSPEDKSRFIQDSDPRQRQSDLDS